MFKCNLYLPKIAAIWVVRVQDKEMEILKVIQETYLNNSAKNCLFNLIQKRHLWLPLKASLIWQDHMLQLTILRMIPLIKNSISPLLRLRLRFLISQVSIKFFFVSTNFEFHLNINILDQATSVANSFKKKENLDRK